MRMFFSATMLSAGIAALLTIQPVTPGGGVTTPPTPPLQPPGAGQTADEVTIADAPVTIVPSEDGTFTVSLVLKNTVAEERSVDVTALLRTTDGTVMTPTLTFVPAVSRVGVGLTPVTVSGKLDRVESAGGWLLVSVWKPVGPKPAAVVAKTVDLKVIPTGREEAILWNSVRWAGLAVGLAFVGLLIRRKWPFRRMGSPAWTFDSWSSNLTVGAALLGALLGYTSLPDAPASISKRGYLVTSLLLTALVTLAPLVYGFFKKTVPVAAAAPGVGSTQTEGFVLLFEVAAVFTLTAAFGQLALVVSLLGDLAASHIITHATADAFTYLVRALRALLWVYGALSVYQTVVAQSVDAPTPSKGLQGKYQLAPRVAVAPWSLL